jgi:PEP-CTERM motif
MGRSWFWGGFFTLLLVLGLSSAASAAAITNGGFEADGGAFGSCPETTPTGWTGGILCDAGFFGAVPPEGTHFAIIGGGGDFPSLSLSQTITGLTIGHSYTVTFDLAGENWTHNTTEQVQVSMLSGSSTGSQTYNAPHSTDDGGGGGGPLWDHWTVFNYAFLATGTSAAIKFVNVSSLANDTGIDSVSIADTTTSGVPEPSTLGLLGIGVGCLSFLRYRNRQQ